VARLRAAGAVILGKLRMHEFAWGNVTPPTRNPWDPTRVPGGSSGGSGAAIAARLCPATLGSDTGGSIRIPAALCGTVGLKATFGRIGRGGVVPHSWSLDHAGPLTMTVADAAAMLQVLAGPDPTDPASASAPVPDYGSELEGGIAGLRIGICRNHFFERAQAPVTQAVEAAIDWFAQQGARPVELSLPNLAYGLGAIFAIELASSTAYHDRSLAAGITAGFAPDVRELVEIGRFVTAPDYLKAEQFRTALMADFARVFERVDLLITPTLPLTAWPIGTWTVEVGDAPESVLAASWRLTYPFNLTGLPALSLPCGFDGAGLPMALQLAARPFAEAMLLRAGRAFEQAHPFWQELPALAA
jgi:aspartyl-tRNA(Asn)/glutamyl-tRNA(Gln) amidotransferase subunit A